ncbi:hypothetical protein Scep_029997 [Stephania cephalantha]|uniref:Pentatricopeptide repeat-containing protein n=1 Tax=Stephania cephalantha TaxID=152367 RepID=A0AAP0DYY8_9MAGN
MEREESDSRHRRVCYPLVRGFKMKKPPREIHGYVVKSGLSSYVTICNALIDSYGKCGNCQASKPVYDQMDERNVVSSNAIMSAFTHNGLREEALEVFRLMVALGNGPDSITLSTFLPVLIEMEGFRKGKEIHGYSIRRSINSDVFVSNCLIDLYAKSGHSTQASNIFEIMERRSVVTWNVMVANFVLNKLELEAIRLMKSMRDIWRAPKLVTFTNVLPAMGE